MLKDISRELGNLKIKKIENIDEDLNDLYEPLCKVENNIKSINRNSKKSIMSIEFLREEIDSKNDEIFSLKKEIQKKQEKEIKIYKKIILILDQIDSIQRFAEQIEDKDLINSLELVSKVVRKEMDQIGLEEIRCMGELFNPDVHKCVTLVEDSSKQSNEIISVIETGYKLDGNVLRVASVIIAK